MDTAEKKSLKELVRSKYSAIARHSSQNRESAAGCCEPESLCCGTPDARQSQDAALSANNSKSSPIDEAALSCSDIMAESYTELDGYNPDADLRLGCGIPVEFAGLRPGQHVLDLGSGAGSDLFVARAVVGENGKLTGIDFSEEMCRKARENVRKMGYKNIRIVTGDIEEMPFGDNLFDVILSNCVLNLVPDKQRAYSEIFRVLRPGGHFSISDIVMEGKMPEQLRKAAEAYVGCVAGAMNKDEYLETVRSAGFTDVTIRKEREIALPESLFNRETDSAAAGFRLLSITLTGTSENYA
jgi:arsenite methyltransferase